MPANRFLSLDSSIISQLVALLLNAKRIPKGVEKLSPNLGCKFVPKAASQLNIALLNDKKPRLATRFPKQDKAVTLAAR